jgi:hypothetical protein
MPHARVGNIAKTGGRALALRLRRDLATLGASLCIMTYTAQAGGIPSRTSPTSDVQWWDEIDLTVPVNAQLDFTWVSWVRMSEDTGGPVTYANGAEAGLKLGDKVTLNPSFYSYESFKVTTQHWVQTREPRVAAIFTTQLRPCALSDRNLMAFVTGSGESYRVYRIRPRIECGMLGKRMLSIFVWDECFYYSQYDRWTRNRFADGVHLQVNNRWGMEIFYVHQIDGEATPRDINGLGMTLQLRW